MKAQCVAMTVLSFCAPLFARASSDFKAQVQDGVGDLTTEKVWSLEPDEFNPHRVRIAIERDLRLVGQKAVRKGDGFALEPGSLELNVKPHWRADANRELSNALGRKFAKEAEKAWPELKKALTGMSSSSAPFVLERADRVFLHWKHQLDARWKKLSRTQASLPESVPVPGLSQAPVRLRAEGELSLQPMARVILKRIPEGWTSRVTLDILGAQLSGVFLIDPEAEQSFVSPGFLDAQGIPKFLQEKVELSTREIRWHYGKSQAAQILVDRLDVGGWAVPIGTLGVMETRLKKFPFDGVIGAEAFRGAVVEFDPAQADRVTLAFWDRETFVVEETLEHPAAKAHPMEASYREGKGWVSARAVEGSLKTRAVVWSLAGKTSVERAAFFDFPHGRVWFKERSEKEPASAMNDAP